MDASLSNSLKETKVAFCLHILLSPAPFPSSLESVINVNASLSYPAQDSLEAKWGVSG